MKALRDEWAREPDFLKCRTLGAVGSTICKSQEEFDQVARFITSHQMIDAVRRGDGLAAKPNGAGLAWIESHKEKWNPQARVALLALIWAIGLAAVGLLVKWLTDAEK